MADTEKKTEVAEAKADKPAKADKSVPAKKKDSFGKRTAKFFREYKSELKKVVWSTPKQTLNNTILVAVSVIEFSSVVSSTGFPPTRISSAPSLYTTIVQDAALHVGSELFFAFAVTM